MPGSMEPLIDSLIEFALCIDSCVLERRELVTGWRPWF